MTNIAGQDETDTPRVRVVIVDDDPLARLGLTTILEDAGDIVVAGADGGAENATALVLKHRPDVVLIDLRMPWADGLAAVAAIRALPTPPKILALTAVDYDGEVLEAIGAGVSGFLPKGESRQGIVDAVHVVAAGGALLSPHGAMTLISHFVASRYCARHHRAMAGLARLTEREREVVGAVAEGKSNAEIACELFMSEATVKTHLSRSFAKLDVSNRVQLTIFAYEAGLAGCGDLCRGPPAGSGPRPAHLDRCRRRIGCTVSTPSLSLQWRRTSASARCRPTRTAPGVVAVARAVSSVDRPTTMRSTTNSRCRALRVSSAAASWARSSEVSTRWSGPGVGASGTSSVGVDRSRAPLR